MDPFEVRLSFISLLSRLTSSLSSIQKVTSFAIKHAPKCSDDIWDCLIEECEQINLNARINLLYFLDILLERSEGGYKGLVERDLGKLVGMVVPDTREGGLNLMSTNQLLKSWKTRRLMKAEVIDTVTTALEFRRASLHNSEIDAESTNDTISTFSRNDVLRRIEDDRERHKRLRERIWVLPIPTTLFTPPPTSTPQPHNQNPTLHSLSSSSRTSPASPSSPSEPLKAHPYARNKPFNQDPISLVANSPPTGNGNNEGERERGPELAIELEFDQLWDRMEEEFQREVEMRSFKRRKLRDGKEEEEGEVLLSMEAELKEGEGLVWNLGEEDLVAMRRERERCFV